MTCPCCEHHDPNSTGLAPGDLLVCNYCGAPLLADPNLNARELRPMEIAVLSLKTRRALARLQGKTAIPVARRHMA